MKMILKGFQCNDDVSLMVGDPHEMVYFIQTFTSMLGIDPYVEDVDTLISTLDEQIKSRFSPNLKVEALDADTFTPATRRTEEIFIAISTTEIITVH